MNCCYCHELFDTGVGILQFGEWDNGMVPGCVPDCPAYVHATCMKDYLEGLL